ncbi:hypothetical protein SPONN_2579 [uncultured Candidatus Thioglobus sp.]|nr:hypothetical protein SPONN_2579 [uncultured Candidatus Thioglobus sp.]SMM98894.1 hypothetical protein SPONL_219 [uncultured Candidatus Thioglobus sp.]
MNISRRKFIGKSVLLGGGVSFAGYVLSKNKKVAVQEMSNTNDKTMSATYQNTRHNRQFYASTRF